MSPWQGCLVSTPNATYNHAIHDFDDKTVCGISLVQVSWNLQQLTRTMRYRQAQRIIRKSHMHERYQGNQSLCPRCRQALGT